MPLAAILGAGPVGGSIAHRLVVEGVFTEVRLVDPAGLVAAAVALDIRQACPLERSDARVEGGSDLEAVRGASLLVVSDRAAEGGEQMPGVPGLPGSDWQGESALALLSRVSPLATGAPVLFAGANPAWLMERAAVELPIPVERLVGSSPVAFCASATALAALECDASALDVHLVVMGRPPDAFVIDWESSLVHAQRATARLDPAATRRIEHRALGLWPPGPYALAAAASHVAHALATRARRELNCLCLLSAPRGRAVALPVRLGPGGVERVRVPHLDGLARARAAHTFDYP